LHTIFNLYVDEYDYEIEELCYLILKNSRLLLKKDYLINLKLDCFNIHNDGSACDVTASDTVYGSSCDVAAPDTVYGSSCDVTAPDTVYGSSCDVTNENSSRGNNNFSKTKKI